MFFVNVFCSALEGQWPSKQSTYFSRFFLMCCCLCCSQRVHNNRNELLLLVLLISLLVWYHCCDSAVELSVRMSLVPGL
jgi:diacylglycerol kinase